MKNLLAAFILSIMPFISYAQERLSNFKTVQINKKVSEFPNIIDLSSPLKTGISILYIDFNGKLNLWNDLSVERNRPSDGSYPKYEVSEIKRNQLLNTRIISIISYEDSVAAIISELDASTYQCRWIEFENGKWYNSGEDLRNTYDEACKVFTNYAGDYLKEIRQAITFAKIPKDTLSFVNFLASESKDPKEMVLQTLSNHKVVAYGEIHRRLLSWNFCRSLLIDPRFYKSVGTIFMEISAHSQKNLDQFISSKTLNTDLILETFRDMTNNGWNDKGMFDFIMDVWKVNQKLTDDKRIKIVAIDVPRPYNTFMKREDIDNYFSKIERDSFMAQTIQNYLLKKKDKRNTFFIVGAAHLSKTTSNAGGILSRSLPKEDLYTYFTHCPRISNNGNIPGKIRHGMFDYVFSKTGNKPLAFNILNSPFGKEPFDGLVGIGSGTYANNYDGYIFLGPLNEEPNGEILYELYNDAFVKELDRRYHLYGSNLKDEWHLKELSKEGIISYLKETEGTLKWGEIPNN